MTSVTVRPARRSAAWETSTVRSLTVSEAAFGDKARPRSLARCTVSCTVLRAAVTTVSVRPTTAYSGVGSVSSRVAPSRTVADARVTSSATAPTRLVVWSVTVSTVLAASFLICWMLGICCSLAGGRLARWSVVVWRFYGR